MPKEPLDFHKPFIIALSVIGLVVFGFGAFGAVKVNTQNSAGAASSLDSTQKTNPPPQTQSVGDIYVADTQNNRIQQFNSSGTYVNKWGTSGSNNGQFSMNEGITVDSSGNVYVIDLGNNRIQKFSPSGTYITQWGSIGSGNGQFDQPRNIAIDPSSNVYVTDVMNNRIEKFTSAGIYLSQWGTLGANNGQFNQPDSIAIDSTGNIYVGDSGNHRIQKFTSTGVYIAQWGGFGNANGQFDRISGIATDTFNNLYVADIDNNRIQKFSSGGVYITQWGIFGSGNSQFNQPTGVATDSSNNIYVTDAGNNRIQKFSSNGNYIFQWGTLGSGNGQFSFPFSVAIYKGPATTQTTTGDKIFLMGGYDILNPYLGNSWRHNVITSSNGSLWNILVPQATWPLRMQHTSLYFNNKIWILGGSGGAGTNSENVWSSPDGISWTLVNANPPWASTSVNERLNHSSVVLNGKMWILGGFDPGSSAKNDVWSSPDGITWTQVTANAPWSLRAMHTSVVFKNKIWVIGGMDGSGNFPFSDTWSSPDGINWTQVGNNLPWGPRYNHASVVFNNKIWILGGDTAVTSSIPKNDVWSSPDGINWTQTTASAPWGGRRGHSAFVLNNKMFVAGGDCSVFQSCFRTDVWSSVDGVNWTQETTVVNGIGSWEHSTVVAPHSFGLGDIQITNINWDGPFHVSSTYPYLQYDLTIQNIGTGSVTLPLTFQVTMTRPAGGVTIYAQVAPGAPITLAPNQTYTFNNVTTVGSTNMRATPQTWLLSAKADSSNVIDESDENNNTYVTSVTVVP